MKVLGNVYSRVGVVYTDMWRIGQDGVRKYWHSSRVMPEDGIIYEQLVHDRVIGICMPSAVIRRGCFAKGGMFDEKFPRLIERDLFIRLSNYFYHIAEPLVNHYDTGKGISSDDKLLIKARKLLLEKYYADIEKNRRSLARYRYVIGNLLCQNGEIDQGRNYLLGAVKSYPLSIKYLIAALVSLFGESAYNKVVKLKRMMQPVNPYFER